MIVLTLLRQGGAHEVQPSVADIKIEGETVEIAIDWVIEAPVAGIDLTGVSNTNEAAQADEYDALRALDPAAMADAFHTAWDDILPEITAELGAVPLDLNVDTVVVPEVGDVELIRISEVTLSATLPPGDGLVFGWNASLGPLVVRQVGVENGYAAFLENGRVSDPIPRGGDPNETAGSAFVAYTGLGFEGFVSLGLDHILFVLGLFFLAAKLGPLMWQIVAFTAAHTVTLVLGALNVLSVPTDIVAPLIAASIVYVGLENVFARGIPPWRPAIVFAFGLAHGLGLANTLQGFGLGTSHVLPKLVGFNIGVEIGQIAVIIGAFIALGWPFSKHGWYKVRIANAVSLAIALIAVFWVFEQTGRISSDGIWAPIAALTEGGMPALWGAGAALLVIVLVTVLVFATDSDIVRDWGGFITSFVVFIAVIGAFTAQEYAVMVGLIVAWVVAIRAQSVGGLDGDPDTIY